MNERLTTNRFIGQTKVCPEGNCKEILLPVYYRIPEDVMYHFADTYGYCPNHGIHRHKLASTYKNLSPIQKLNERLADEKVISKTHETFLQTKERRALREKQAEEAKAIMEQKRQAKRQKLLLYDMTKAERKDRQRQEVKARKEAVKEKVRLAKVAEYQKTKAYRQEVKEVRQEEEKAKIAKTLNDLADSIFDN